MLFRIHLYLSEINEQNYEGRDIIFEKKDKRHQKKNLIVYLLELIQVTQKEVTIQTMKLVKYKYLSVNLKKRNNKKKKTR